jgi:Tol biopolymer transport system component
MSPIADEIAYHTVDDAGVMNVWIPPARQRAARQITHDTESTSYPSWSPDGQRLAVEIKRGDRTYVGVVGRDGGEPVPLMSDRGQNWPHSWSPDGEWIAVRPASAAASGTCMPSRHARAKCAKSRGSHRRADGSGTPAVATRRPSRVRARDSERRRVVCCGQMTGGACLAW